jgi:hypothetical protein
VRLGVKPHYFSNHVESVNQSVFFRVEDDQVDKLYRLGRVTIGCFRTYILEDLKDRSGDKEALFWICKKNVNTGLSIPVYIPTSLSITEDDLKVLTGLNNTRKDKLKNIQKLELKYPPQSEGKSHPNQSSTLVKMYTIAFHVFRDMGVGEDMPKKQTITNALLDWGIPKKEAEVCVRVLCPSDEAIDKDKFLSERLKGVLDVWKMLYKNIDPYEKDSQPDRETALGLLNEYCPSMSEDDKTRICTSLRPDLISSQGR